MLRLEMLPAAHGDCLWIEYGIGADIHRILIDGGPSHTYPTLRERILHLPESERNFELLIITHVDADHIEGVVRLLQDSEALACNFKRIWFNGRDQLNKVPDAAGESLGALQGEYLGILIADYEKRTGKKVWNVDFDNGVVTTVPSEELPVVTLGGDCRLTLLSPDFTRLRELKYRWREELEKAHVTSGDEQALRRKLEANKRLRPLGDVLGAEDDDTQAPSELPLIASRTSTLDDVLGGADDEDTAFGGDTSKANGSSIAVLLEYPTDRPKVKLLLAGDAWASVLEKSIGQLLGDEDATLSLTGFKIPHHGSIANISEELLKKIKCKNYLVSTSGAIFGHPHSRAIELLLAHHQHRAKPGLHFNYLTRTTETWCDDKDQKERKYKTFYPKGLSLEF
jgi:hypothetical protein